MTYIRWFGGFALYRQHYLIDLQLLLFYVTTGILHRVQLAVLVNFPNAVLNATRSILKQDKRRSDPRDFLSYRPVIY